MSLFESIPKELLITPVRNILSELPREVIVPVFLQLITYEQGVSSLEAALKAFPYLCHHVLIITDHERDSLYSMFKVDEVQHVSLDEFDSSPLFRRTTSSHLRIFSFNNYKIQLATTHNLTSSLRCLYGRYLSSATPVIIGKDPELDVFYTTLSSLAMLAQVPVVIPCMAEMYNQTPLFGSRDIIVKAPKCWSDPLSLWIYGRQKYLIESCKIADVFLSTKIGYDTRFDTIEKLRSCNFNSLVTLNVLYKRPFQPYDPHTPTQCHLNEVACDAPLLKNVYVGFETCKLPQIIILPGSPLKRKPGPLGFRQSSGQLTEEVIYLPSINHNYGNTSCVLDNFTLENRRWSVNHPHGDGCSNSVIPYSRLYTPDHSLWITEAMYSVDFVEFMVRSKKISLIGIPAQLVLDKVYWSYVEEFSWWKLSPTRHYAGLSGRNLEPIQCPALIKLKIFAVVSDTVIGDPPFLINAPLLQEVQLVGLVSSNMTWDLDQMLNGHQDARPREPAIMVSPGKPASKWEIWKEKTFGGHVPLYEHTISRTEPQVKLSGNDTDASAARALSTVMLGQYHSASSKSSTTSIPIDLRHLGPAPETVESLAIVGYVPIFMIGEKSQSTTSHDFQLFTFRCLKSLTLDVSWIIPDSGRLTTNLIPTTSINLCEASYPSLEHLKLVVPQQSWSRFEHAFAHRGIKRPVLEVLAPRKTKNITLSSCLLYISIVANNQPLITDNLPNLGIVSGVEHTWSQRSNDDCSESFALDLDYHGKTFTEEWDFDNCVYDTYVPHALQV